MAAAGSEDGRAEIVLSSGRILELDGGAAQLSFDRDGKLKRVISSGTKALVFDGKKLPHGGMVSGRLTSNPSGLARSVFEEKNATVAVDAEVPASAVNQWLLIRQKNGSVGSFRISGVQKLEKGSLLTLNRSARKLILFGDVDSDGQTLRIYSGGCVSLKPGDSIQVGEKLSLVEKVVCSERPRELRAVPPDLGTLTEPVSPAVTGRVSMPVTECSSGDEFTIPLGLESELQNVPVSEGGKK